MLSHNGARELLDITRLDADEVLKAVADTGGVIGIQSAPHNVASPDHPKHTIESVMDHFEYVKDPSASIMSRSAPTRSTATTLACTSTWGKITTSTPTGKISSSTTLRGWRTHGSVAQHPRWLVREGYTDEEIHKVLEGTRCAYRRRSGRKAGCDFR